MSLLMSVLEDRRVYLFSLMEGGSRLLSVYELNEMRDCEIALGMPTAAPKERAEAASRLEALAAQRGGSL